MSASKHCPSKRQGLSDAASTFTHRVTRGENAMPDGSTNAANTAATTAHANLSHEHCACRHGSPHETGRAEILAYYLASVKAHLEKLDEHCQAIFATRDFVEARCKQVGEDRQAHEKWAGYTVMLSVTAGAARAEADLYEAFNSLLEQLPEAAAEMRRMEAAEAD